LPKRLSRWLGQIGWVAVEEAADCRREFTCVALAIDGFNDEFIQAPDCVSNPGLFICQFRGRSQIKWKFERG
jgi:hypothetical protein